MVLWVSYTDLSAFYSHRLILFLNWLIYEVLKLIAINYPQTKVHFIGNLYKPVAEGNENALLPHVFPHRTDDISSFPYFVFK